MLKLIHRSILLELAIAFFLTLAFLNSVLMMEKLLRLSRLLSGVGAKAYDMVKIIFYLQPQLLLLTIPMAMLLSTLLVYGRLNLDSEMVILKTSGMNFGKISYPVMILGLFCFFSSTLVSFHLGPQSSARLRAELTKIIAVRSTFAIEEGTFSTAFKDLVILVKGKKTPDTLEDIFIYDSRRKEEPKVLMAREGSIFMQEGGGIGLYLKEGYMNITRGKTMTEIFFNAYKLILHLDADPSSPKKIEFSPLQLLKKAKESTTEKEKASLYLEFHRRLSLPAVCLILIALGPPLSLMAGKSGRLGGLAIGLSVFTIYYIILLYGENLVIAAHLPHYIGAWISAVILGGFALFLFRSEYSK
ncbi:MAG: LptF/LptG family permease [Nitrospirae bacterium]|nr:LptF/LptG family permease [Nitrospirota bacterium]